MSGMFDLALLPLGDRLGTGALSYSSIQGRLGHRTMSADGKEWILVQLSEAAGNASPGNKALQIVSAALYTVKTCATIGADVDSRPVGHMHPDQKALTQGDLFYAQVSGRVEGILGDGTAWAAGDLVRCSGDTDLGKLERAATNGETHVAMATLYLAVDAAAADGDVATLDIIGKLW